MHRFDPDDPDRTILANVVLELEAAAPMHLAIAPGRLFELAGLLQLAGRHPSLSEGNRRALVWFLEHARQHFADCPAVLEVIRRGDDPRQDR